LFGYLGPQLLGLLRDRTGGFTAGWCFVAAGAMIALIDIVLLRRYARATPAPIGDRRPATVIGQ